MSRSTQHPLEIWHIPAVTDSAALQQLSKLLSPAELQRAQRLNSAVQRNTFISAHAAMRQILAEHLQLQPAALVYSYNVYGKPQLDSDKQIFFNLSHTHAYALLVLSPVYEVGIDIEIIRSSRDTLAIARRFFTEREYNWLCDTEPEQRDMLFYQLWCYKEACLKATGLGLQGGLSSFSLELQDIQQQTIFTDREHKPWYVQAFEVPKPYLAAFAVEQPDFTAEIHHWNYL
jgi:4'-phosphopantetheinyl transferase